MSSSVPHHNLAQRQQEKAALRRRLLKARQAIPEPIWQHKSDRICEHLRSWPQFQQARCILAYWSFRNEPDLSPLMNPRQRWGLPRCVDQSLYWHDWQGQQRLQPGAFGILEPSPQAPRIPAQQVNMILVPAVACDITGYRLGYGGGFYDRMLSQPAWRHAITIGIVFEYARLPKVPRNPWDRAMQGVCSEAGLYLSDVISGVL